MFYWYAGGVLFNVFKSKSENLKHYLYPTFTPPVNAVTLFKEEIKKDFRIKLLISYQYQLVVGLKLMNLTELSYIHSHYIGHVM